MRSLFRSPLLFLLFIPVVLVGQDAPAPLYRCPIYDGAADPVVVYNHEEQNWWMLYTARRANMESADVAYCYGTRIGAASSSDHGQTWVFRGFLELAFEWGINTFWAPEVLYNEGIYHLYVSYIEGVRNHWGGEKHIIHYTSRDLKSWHKESVLRLSSDVVIDACVYQMPDKTWRMLYKDETMGSLSMAAESPDLYQWTALPAADVSDRPHEGPKVFRYQQYYWLIVDQWAGLAVYRSTDGESWVYTNTILQEASDRPQDGPSGAHADILVVSDKAYIFYFTHPGRDQHVVSPMNAQGNVPYDLRRSVIQVAQIKIKDGKLEVKRNNFNFFLPTL